MKKAALHNLGCKVNGYETEAMQRLLEEDGYEIVPFHEKADVYVINTCTVTNMADRKSRQMLHRARKLNPDAVIVAAGCYVQAQEAKGQEIVANALTQYGDKIEAVFCNNDAMALGAAQAITAAGRTVGKDIYLVGVDALAEAVDLVSTDMMTGTVLNDHITQAHKAVDAAVSAVNGEKLSAYYWVDYVKVTPKNASQFK